MVADFSHVKLVEQKSQKNKNMLSCSQVVRAKTQQVKYLTFFHVFVSVGQKHVKTTNKGGPTWHIYTRQHENTTNKHAVLVTSTCRMCHAFVSSPLQHDITKPNIELVMFSPSQHKWHKSATIVKVISKFKRTCCISTKGLIK